ncbi:MAG: hypothetical protein J3Q66DRAFT_404945 [Benniella sp.]|nr:MAG: hypothetical protein J3Q66DRAFT_404945 [Benniella sp.]
MASTHPLEIPEILLCITRYVPTKSLPACARVSKAWYQTFMPAIWKEINPHDYDLGASIALQSHRDLVKSLVLFDPTQGPESFTFPNLHSLFVTGTAAQTATKMILEHNTISCLIFLDSQPPPGLWAKLLEFPNLNRLDLYQVNIDANDTDAFWQLCTHLEKLRVHDTDIVDRSQLSSMEFPRLKELDILQYHRRSGFSIAFMDFMSRCPSLTSCKWANSPVDDELFMPKFLELLDEKTWPDLHSLRILEHTISQDDLSRILIGMPAITSLDIPFSPDNFKSNMMDLLRPRFSRLAVLHLRSIDHRVMCPMAQEFLSSCPLLESFQATRIDAALVAEGKPWVCLGLKDLNLRVVFDPSTIHHVQPRVLDQLSRLTRLQRMSLWTDRRTVDMPVARFQETVDMRLENGLGKLSTMRALQSLDFEFSEQRMENQEIDWILEHWRCLEWVHGILNKQDPEVDRTLRKRLRSHGMMAIADLGIVEESSEEEFSEDEFFEEETYESSL